ncbi:MAG: T9SS type A sorting domain-containing protein [Ignavibacteria bacterium]|nr:T9SS type A sorting domain-containing protein [Ignavibacteria bacterium]
MKSTIKLLAILALVTFVKPVAAEVPYAIELEQLTLPGAPKIHSFAFAESEGKWLFLAGRTNGLHGFNPNNAFPKQYSNTKMYVVDPVSLQTWSRSIFTDLPLESADQLRSMNMQYYQKGNKLYFIGGYGYDSTLNSFITFPLLKVIDVRETIQAIISGSSVAPHIRQVSDLRMQVCGGELQILDGYFNLVGGHKFTGEYSQTVNDQVYTNQIRRFKISEAADEVSISDYSALTDTVEYHRRDMNLVPAIRPQSLEEYLIVYGGVFRSYADLPFLNPVYIYPASAQVDYSFEQKIGQYTCAYMSAFDSQTGDMHTSLFGGMSLYSYYEQIDSLVYDSLVPFINDINTITKRADGTSVERLSSTRLPALLGTNAKFIISSDLPKFSNNVIKLSEVTGRTFAGYIFGGIRALLPNNTPSYPSEYILRVFITPQSVSVTQISQTVPGGFELNQNYPNPFNPSTKISFSIPSAGAVKLAVYDKLGRTVAELVNRHMPAGSYETTWSGESNSSGIYFLRLEAGSFSASRKMLLLK